MGASHQAPFIWRKVFLEKRAKSHLATIGDKIIVETLYSNRVTKENKSDPKSLFAEKLTRLGA